MHLRRLRHGPLGFWIHKTVFCLLSYVWFETTSVRSVFGFTEPFLLLRFELPISVRLEPVYTHTTPHTPLSALGLAVAPLVCWSDPPDRGISATLARPGLAWHLLSGCVVFAVSPLGKNGRTAVSLIFLV